MWIHKQNTALSFLNWNVVSDIDEKYCIHVRCEEKQNAQVVNGSLARNSDLRYSILIVLKIQFFGLLKVDTWKESYDKPRQCIKKQRHHFAYKGSYNKKYGFSSSHVQMWELDKEGWVPKNGCFQIVLEKPLQSPLDCKEIQPVNPHLTDWCWISNTSATQHEKLTHWKRPWCWGRLKAKEGGSRGWDG